jgi:hypothetical protein
MVVFSYSEVNARERRIGMTIHLTPEQEELNALLAEGLASGELTEAEFWSVVNSQTESLLDDHKSGLRS